MITLDEIIDCRGRPRVFGSIAAIAFVRIHRPLDPDGSVTVWLPSGLTADGPLAIVAEGLLPWMCADFWSTSEAELTSWILELATNRGAWYGPPAEFDITIVTGLQIEQTQRLSEALLPSLRRLLPNVRSLAIMGPAELVDVLNSLDHSEYAEWMKRSALPTSPREWAFYRDYGLVWPRSASSFEERVRCEFDLHPSGLDLVGTLSVLGDFLHARGESLATQLTTALSTPSLVHRREDYGWGTRQSVLAGPFVLRASVSLRSGWEAAKGDMNEWLDLPECRYLSPKRLGILGLSEFPWVDCSGFDFSGMNFADRTFDECLAKANFERACFFDPLAQTSAAFNDCDARWVNFADADLRAAHFSACDFRGAIFNSADLRGISVDRCDFSGATFRGARLDTGAFAALANGGPPRSKLNMAVVRAEAYIE